VKEKLINYELFRQRKNFNPLSLFYKNEDFSYQDFVNFFISRSVNPPDLNYYNRVKKAFEENQNKKVDLEKKNKNTVEIKEIVSLEKELPEEEKLDINPTEKTQKKRRSRKKKQS
jgi:hypothetical protein